MKLPASSRTRKAGKSSKNESRSVSQREKSKNSIENQQVCAACLFQISSASQDYCSTQCSHHYHEKCLEQWLKQKNTCCLCRQKIKKYTSKAKGEVTVPEPERSSFFDLLIPLSSFSSSNEFPEIIFFQGTMNNPWLFLSSNQPNTRNHFILSIGRGRARPSIQNNSFELERIGNAHENSWISVEEPNQQPEEIQENNNQIQSPSQEVSRPPPKSKPVKKPRKTYTKTKRITRSSARKEQATQPKRAKQKKEKKPLGKKRITRRNIRNE